MGSLFTGVGSFFYQTMLIVAAFAAFIMLNVIMKKTGFSKFVRKRVRNALFWAAFLATIASNLANWLFHEEIMDLSLYDRLVGGGFSLMVWIPCFIGASALFLRWYKFDLHACLDVIAPPMLLASFFARIGCIFGGCCYGIELKIFDLSFNFPVREIELLFALALSILLCFKFTKGKRMAIYMFAYSGLRFVLEFLRGDDRGAIFGFDLLSPTQIIAIIIIITTLIIVIVKACKRPKNNILPQNAEIEQDGQTEEVETAEIAEETSEEMVSEEETVVEQASDEKAETTAKKYVPRPIDFYDPKIKSNPFRIILSILLIISILASALFIGNPLNVKWVSNLKYFAQENVGFLFDEGGSAYDIGASNSLGVIKADKNLTVNSEAEALELIQSYDGWNNSSYAYYKTTALKNGNTVLTFVQDVDGVPIVNRAASVVMAGNRPLFVIRDAAGDSFATQIVDYKNTIEAVGRSDNTFRSYLSSGDEIVNAISCFYDTGEGLVSAEFLEVRGTDDEFGIIIDSESEQIIEIKETPELAAPELRGQLIVDASAKVRDYIENGDKETIGSLRRYKAKNQSVENLSTAVEGALCRAYQKTKLDDKTFIKALDITGEIASVVPDLNEQLYCDILTEVVEQTASESGLEEKKAEKCADRVEAAFKASGIQQNEDENTVQVDAGDKEKVLKQAINSANDNDVIKLHMEENHSMTVEISSDIGIDIEVYTSSGQNLLTTYTSSENGFKLYSENGTDYIIKIKASDTQSLFWEKESDYEVSVAAEESANTIPSFVNSTIYEISSSFTASNMYPFGLLFYGDAAFTAEEWSMITLIPVVDNCATSCASCDGGEVEAVDSAKECIVDTLIMDLAAMRDDVRIGPDTVMEISCFRFIETEKGALVKLKVVLNDKAGGQHVAYSFIRLETVEDFNRFDFITTLAEELGEDVASAEKLADMLNTVFGQKHYITEINTDELMNAFGDTFDNISEENGMPSLYDFWKVPSDPAYSYLREFDREAAIAAGYSIDSVDEFEKFTMRHNLAYCERARDNSKLIRDSMLMYKNGVISAQMLYNVIDDPFGAVLGELTDDPIINGIYKIGKLAWDLHHGKISSLEDEIMDSARDDFIGQEIDTYVELLDREIERLAEHIEDLEEEIKVYRAELRKFGKYYFWETIF